MSNDLGIYYSNMFQAPLSQTAAYIIDPDKHIF